MANSVEEAIYTYITADSTFMAKVTRLDYMETPTGTAEPYINYWLVSDPGYETLLNYNEQGEARIQFDLWDSDRIRGTRLRRDLRKLIKDLNEAVGGYHLMVIGATENTIPRESGADPFHFVVDGIVRWRKE